jgi:hypothetical protein
MLLSPSHPLRSRFALLTIPAGLISACDAMSQRQQSGPVPAGCKGRNLQLQTWLQQVPPAANSRILSIVVCAICSKASLVRKA